MITVYGGNNSRATRNFWVLEELGLAYDQKKIDFAGGENKKPEFLAINPSGKVPALGDSDGNVVLSESFAINLYLAQRYSVGKLWPADHAGQAKCLQWTMWAATEVEGHVVGLIVEKVFKPEALRSAEVAKKCEELFTPALKYIDAQLAGKEWLLGNSFTIADLQCACVINGLNMVRFDFAPYPNLAKWLKACTSRPAQMKVASMPRG